MNTERTDEEILSALERWLKRIPNPEEMILIIPSGGRQLTFSEALREIKNNTTLGKKWLEKLKNIAGRHEQDIVKFIDSIET